MLVIADTTPIISLLKISRLDLLEKLFVRVKVPKAVYRELTQNPNFAAEAEAVRQCGFLEVAEPSRPEAAAALRERTGLDDGESEAIVLAEELCADLVLLDEEAGRAVALSRGLAPMGTIGILIAARKRGFVTGEEIKNAVNTFQQAGRFISENLYRQLMDFAG